MVCRIKRLNRVMDLVSWIAKGIFQKSLHRKQREFWGPKDLEAMYETVYECVKFHRVQGFSKKVFTLCDQDS